MQVSLVFFFLFTSPSADFLKKDIIIFRGRLVFFLRFGEVEVLEDVEVGEDVVVVVDGYLLDLFAVLLLILKLDLYLNRGRVTLFVRFFGGIRKTSGKRYLSV
jgi:hypothetical protein